jgi:hypothetical protein
MVVGIEFRMTYRLNFLTNPPPLNADWSDPAWRGTEELSIAHFRPESSSHRPQTFARLGYTAEGLHGIFLVRDRFVRCQRKHYFDEVWKDSCVEFFVEPKTSGGYFNFEFNCGGAFLCNYITDATRDPQTIWVASQKVPPDLGQLVQVKSSLPALIDPEITTPLDWSLQFFIPFALLEKFTGPLGDIRGQTWRGNFFKCAEEVSHPHWAAWSTVDEFNFHLPRCFGALQFAG